MPPGLGWDPYSVKKPQILSVILQRNNNATLIYRNDLDVLAEKYHSLICGNLKSRNAIASRVKGVPK